MRRSRFTQEQNIAVLREQEAGIATVAVRRKHGIISATFYAWKVKFGGMDVPETKRLKTLEDENAKRKRLLADAMRDNVALKDLLTRNADARRQAGGCRPSHHGLRDERAAGASGHPGGSQDGPLPILPAR
jgi:putative transposase